MAPLHQNSVQSVEDRPTKPLGPKTKKIARACAYMATLTPTIMVVSHFQLGSCPSLTHYALRLTPREPPDADQDNLFLPSRLHTDLSGRSRNSDSFSTLMYAISYRSRPMELQGYCRYQPWRSYLTSSGPYVNQNEDLPCFISP